MIIEWLIVTWIFTVTMYALRLSMRRTFGIKLRNTLEDDPDKEHKEYLHECQNELMIFDLELKGARITAVFGDGGIVLDRAIQVDGNWRTILRSHELINNYEQRD